MRTARRLFRRRLIAIALAAMCSLALASSAVARYPVEPNYHNNSVVASVADPNGDQQGSASPAVTDPNGNQQSPAQPSAPASSASTDSSGVSTLAFVLSLGGIALLAAGAAAGVSSRHNRQHGTA